MTAPRSAIGCHWLPATPLGAALLLIATSCGPKPVPTGPDAPSGPQESLFVDVASAAGVAFTYRNGEEADHYAILESLGGGVGLLDYDGDGLLDLFLTGGGTFDGPAKQDIKGHPCRLYKNLGDWKFKDVSADAGLDKLADGKPWFYSHGVAAADYDCDGHPDLLVTGYGELALFHNEPDGRGGRRFNDATRKAGLAPGGWPTSAGWADLDGDGWPELYVCHYANWSFTNHPVCAGYTDEVRRDVCPPKKFTALPHRLYRNKKDDIHHLIARC